jgi:hypothetical protein
MPESCATLGSPALSLARPRRGVVDEMHESCATLRCAWRGRVVAGARATYGINTALLPTNAALPPYSSPLSKTPSWVAHFANRYR